eukprot:5285414-Alexandrium_andersonii.AAC.1
MHIPQLLVEMLHAPTESFIHQRKIACTSAKESPALLVQYSASWLAAVGSSWSCFQAVAAMPLAWPPVRL